MQYSNLVAANTCLWWLTAAGLRFERDAHNKRRIADAQLKEATVKLDEQAKGKKTVETLPGANLHPKDVPPPPASVSAGFAGAMEDEKTAETLVASVLKELDPLLKANKFIDASALLERKVKDPEMVAVVVLFQTLIAFLSVSYQVNHPT
jgi:hypothetical protein